MSSPRELFSRYFTKTPTVEARHLARSVLRPGSRLFLKLETELPTGSFKVRGALWALSRRIGDAPQTGSAALSGPRMTEVVASSTGNHGAAAAWAAQQLGLRARIFLPRNPNPVKRANIASFGAAIVEVGRDIAGAFDAATRYSAESGAFFLNDATDPEVPVGAGTIADEILEDLPAADVIYVPVGDTALIRGVASRAKALKPSIRIVGVQAEQAPSYYLSWKSGVATPTDTCDTIADGLATRTPVEENVQAIRELVDDMVLVSEDAMAGAVASLRRDEGVTAEPASAATLAACANAREAARAVVLLITGRNIRAAAES